MDILEFAKGLTKTMTGEEMHDEKELEQELFDAMRIAYKSFNQYLEGLGYDPVFFSLYLTGHLLNQDFSVQQEIKYNPNNLGKKSES